MSDVSDIEMAQAATPGPDHKRLQSFIGRWITEGETIPEPDQPAVKILASDIYEWAPGRFFVIHTAYGRIGDVDVGGIEFIGYDPDTGQYRTWFFDSQGHVSTQQLTFRDGVWQWRDERTRATARLSDDGKTLPTHHERSDDGVHWIPSMDVTLTRVD
jgi:uncharacterized protein DUF1579